MILILLLSKILNGVRRIRTHFSPKRRTHIDGTLPKLVSALTLRFFAKYFVPQKGAKLTQENQHKNKTKQSNDTGDSSQDVAQELTLPDARVLIRSVI